MWFYRDGPSEIWIRFIQTQLQKNWHCPTIFALFAVRIWLTHRRNCHVAIFSIQRACDHGSKDSKHVQHAVWIFYGIQTLQQIRPVRMMEWINWTIIISQMQLMQTQRPPTQMFRITTTMRTIFSMHVSWVQHFPLFFSSNFILLTLVSFRSKSIRQYFECATECEQSVSSKSIPIQSVRICSNESDTATAHTTICIRTASRCSNQFGAFIWRRATIIGREWTTQCRRANKST